MKVLAINGSSRKNRNTAIILNTVLEELEKQGIETEMIQLADMNPQILKHKIGASVVACRRGGALNTIDTLNHFFLNHEMFVVGSTYWNMVYGQISGDVKNDEEGMANMKNLGENMAYLLKKIKE